MKKFNKQQLASIVGGRQEDGDGVKVISITGLNDGIKGNTHLYIFGIRIF